MRHHTAHPSTRTTPPADVTDPLLWALAMDVAAAHRPGPKGDCTNLQCRGQRGACRALRAAQRAVQLARPTPASPPPAVVEAPIVPGFAIANRRRRSTSTTFTGWFTPTDPRPALPDPPTPRPRPQQATDRRDIASTVVGAPPRRPLLSPSRRRRPWPGISSQWLPSPAPTAVRQIRRPAPPAPLAVRTRYQPADGLTPIPA